MPRRIPPYAPVIRYLRHCSGWTESQLAKKIGVPDYYVGYLENGYRSPRPDLIRSLAAAFGWLPFELALMADVEIPYPDWPSLTDLEGWRRLAQEWIGIADAITRYVLARELTSQPGWQAELDSELPPLVDQYGLVATYDWLRRRWVAHEPHPLRFASSTSPQALMAAASAGSTRRPATVEPDFLDGLSPADRTTVEAVARSLKARTSPP